MLSFIWSNKSARIGKKQDYSEMRTLVFLLGSVVPLPFKIIRIDKTFKHQSPQILCRTRKILLKQASKKQEQKRKNIRM